MKPFLSDECLKRTVANALREKLAAINEAGLFDDDKVGKKDVKKGGGAPEKKIDAAMKSAKGVVPAVQTQKDDKPKKDAGDVNKSSDNKDKTAVAKQPKQSEPEQPQTKVEPTEIPKPENISYDMIVQQLNTVRSGRSLRDKNISNQMLKYFNSLSKEEHVMLWTFLNGLSEILAGNISGDDATSPSDSNDVEIVATNGKKSANDDVDVDNKREKTLKGAHEDMQKKAPHDDEKVKQKREIEDTMAPIKVVRKK